MTNIRKIIESGFEQLAHTIYQNKWKTLLIMAFVIALFLSQLPKIKIDTSTEGFLHENDPALVAYNKFREQFGRDDLIVIAIKPENIFDAQFLLKLKSLHNALEKGVPYLDEVTSLINIRNTRGEGDTLIVEDLLKIIPMDREGLKNIEIRIRSNPLYKNLIISQNGKMTTLIVKTNATAIKDDSNDILAGFTTDEQDAEHVETTPQFLTDAQNSEVVKAINDITRQYDDKEFPISIAGSPIIIDYLKQSMQKDMRKFTMLAIGIIAIILFLLFKRISGVVIPIAIVVVSLLSTIGLMALFGIAIKLPTQILPSFLLAVGVASCVHLLALFFVEFDRNNDKEQAISQALGHSGLPICMASLTTAAGLLSFSTAEVAPIADLGIFVGIGVMLSFIYTIILTPALLSLFPLRTIKHTNKIRRHEIADKILMGLAKFSTEHAKCILIATAIIFITTIISTSQIRFYHNPLLWLPESTSVRAATTLIDREMQGSNTAEVVIDTGKENGLYDPILLNKIEDLHLSVNSIKNDGLFVGKTISLNNIIKETNQALHENNRQFYQIPDNRELIAQELLLFENSGSDDIEDFVDSQFSKARFTLKIPWVDAHSNARFLADIEKLFNESLKGMASIEVTGMVSLLARAMSAAIDSTKVSYIIAALVITLMMIMLLGDIKLGLVSMIPNLLPILITMGFMAYMEIPLDMFTMLIGSIAIGLAVDDTIHFMHNFQRYYNKSGNVQQAIQNTLQTTGRAILVTTIVLASGFFIFIAASMSNLANFGKICGLTIIIALFADLLIAPALVTVLYQNRQPASKINTQTTPIHEH